MAEDYISQFYTWATGNTITAARLNGNVSNVTDGLSGGMKAVNVGKILLGGFEAIDSSRNATLESITLSGDITSISVPINWYLRDNNASALSFDASGKLGLIAIDTTNGAEGVSMSGFLTVTGTLTATQGTLTSLTVSGDLTVDTDTLYVDSSNNAVGINITSPDASSLHLDGDSSGLASPQLRITDAGGASEASIYNASGVLTLATHGTDNVLDNGILIGTAAQGTIIFKTSNTTAMTILSSQKVQFPNGLTFGADTVDDNTLDDYEEGSWTPTITNAGAYTTQYGRYTKIGRMVFLHLKLHATGVTQDATWVTVSGLPFAAADTSDTQQRSCGVVEGDWVGFGSYASTTRFRVNSSTLQGVRDSGGGNSTTLVHTDLGTTIEFHTTVSYYAAT
jgi:hypothetical protein